VPTIPGESTNTPSKPAEDEAGGADLGPQDEAGADSGTRRQATALGAHTEDEAPSSLPRRMREGSACAGRRCRTGSWTTRTAPCTLPTSALCHYRSFFNRLLVT
jgi:hypothetical protein